MSYEANEHSKECYYEMRNAVIAMQPVASCSDAISRQAVDTLVDELARAISDERCCISRGRSTATIMQDILDLPPVTPKQRTGHWIECEDEVKCFCSECKEISDYPTKFCPNCGAKMEEMKE